MEDKIYQKWIENKKQIELSGEFADKTMLEVARIAAQKQKRILPWSSRFSSLSIGAIARLGLVGAGMIGGLIRILIVLRLLFGCSQAKGFF